MWLMSKELFDVPICQNGYMYDNLFIYSYLGEICICLLSGKWTDTVTDMAMI